MARTLRTDRGLDRLVNFSDATVAIAITLLLLPLVDVADEISDKSLGEVVNAHWGTLVAFGVSFLVIARLWMPHHRLFEATQSYSRPIIYLNFLWLASIVFLPFTSNLIAHRSGDPAVNAFYICTIATSSLAMAAMEWVVWRDPALIREDGRGMLRPIDATVTFGTLLVVLLLAVVLPGPGLLWLLLLAPAARLARWIERRVDRTRVIES